MTVDRLRPLPDDPRLYRLKLLTARQVADLLGVNPSTVWRWIYRVNNPLPVVRLSDGVTRFRLSAVEKFIAGGEQ